MTLTMPGAPLASRRPDTTNYSIEGPQHLLLATPFPRRIRALLDGEVVLDTRRGVLLHESNLLPQLYVPADDVRSDLLERTDTSTHCPFKGDASYWSIRVGDRTAEDAVWGYEAPNDDVPWLADHLAVYWDRVDGWFDEDEEVFGHLRDPYHRVDTRPSSRHVVVRLGDTVLAETRRPVLLSETGLPNRYYLPPADVRTDVLRPSATHTHCPYKGEASYKTVEVDGRRVEDAAWTYPRPFADALAARDLLCFSAEGIVTEVDGEAVD